MLGRLILPIMPLLGKISTPVGKDSINTRLSLVSSPQHAMPTTTTRTSPISVGAGFLTLDMLLIGRTRIRANRQYAGGSCGNVLSILAYLDWASYPVARLGTDRRAQLLIDDLKSCHVNTEFVTKERTGVTPVIVVRVAETENGSYKTKFEWKDPHSGAWLPRYRPLPKRIAEQVTAQLPAAKVFYFDRAEPSSLMLATAMRERGAVVFFEPSSCKDDDIFTACLSVSDIVKYSADRVSTPPRNPVSESPRMEIQTLGETGLRYRLKVASHRPGPWHILPSFQVSQFTDATGCGDWCSAGIIAQLCARGREQFIDMTEVEIVKGIRFGQALAAINCEYKGARGSMYTTLSQNLITRAEDMVALDQYSVTGSRSTRSTSKR